MQAADFPFQSQYTVIFRDLDSLNHMNHARYLTYMEAARVNMMAQVLEVAPAQLSLPIILVKVECRYKAPAVLGDQITVGMGISRFGNTSYDIIYQLDRQDGTVLAHARTVIAMYDYDKASTFPVPDTLKQRVALLQAGWSPPEITL